MIFPENYVCNGTTYITIHHLSNNFSVMSLLSFQQLHKHIGKEPSGLKFNEIALDSEGR